MYSAYIDLHYFVCDILPFGTPKKIKGKILILKDCFFTHFAIRIAGRLWWTQHFNGQVKRFDFISACLSEGRFTDVIETGTFLGNSTIALASLSESRIHSIEINPRFFRVAKERIDSNYEHLDIKLYQGSSDVVLRQILDELNPDQAVLFLYLDAHWGNKLPLFSEIEALNRWGGKFIAVIDDFEILEDSGYGFDQYGDQVVGRSLIPLTKQTRLYRLRAPSFQETGSRRGTGIVINNDLSGSFSKNLMSKILEIVD